MIVESIRAMGVRPGDLLIVHSSYKRLRIAAPPADVAQALVDAISPGGSVFVPTFNYGNDPFDSATAPSYDGIITEYFRMRPDARRSLHPTHPMAGIGPDAENLLRDHDKAQPFGRGSPCWRLWERDAWILLLGVNQNANSMVHVAEEMLEMPYLDRRRTAKVVTPEGIREVTVRRPGCSDAWDPVLDPALRAAGAIVDGRIENAPSMLMRAREVVDVTMTLLRRDPQALLCHRPDCDACNTARRMLQT